VPFGFKDAYFYDQIQYAADGLHVFTYSFLNDVGDFFATLLSGGLQIAAEARASLQDEPSPVVFYDLKHKGLS
jgi:hypothetical protein